MMKMICVTLVVLAYALAVESYSVHDLHERLTHGRQLKIYLPKSAEKLIFTPEVDPGQPQIYWERAMHRTLKGRVSGTGSDRRWYLDKVTHDDQGTYIQKDFFNKEISRVLVAVTPRHNFVKCLAGETLYIPLEGINMADASLSFSGNSANVTLVSDGAAVSQNLPDYWDRVETRSMNIEIKNVNFTDEGRYTLIDRRNRLVSITRMDITDRKDYTEGNPLLALLLLLGIPAGVCCCCRKKIFKKKPATAAVLQTSPGVIHAPVAGPVGPCPPYTDPGQPGGTYYHGPGPNMGPSVHPPPNMGPGQWNGPAPYPGNVPMYPPVNPVYPPPGPGMIPPGQPHWNGPPPGQYPPGAVAMGPGPVMYSAPPPGNEPAKVNLEPSAAVPLLSSEPQEKAATSPYPPATTVSLSTSDDVCKFQIDGGEKSTNFL